jgi:hypothetical protein
MIVFGLLIIVAGAFGQGISYGMPPHRQKPMYAMTRRLRVVLLSFGLLFVALGLAKALHM